MPEVSAAVGSVPISVVAEPEDVPEQSGGIAVIEPVELVASKMRRAHLQRFRQAQQYFEAAVNQSAIVCLV